MCIDILGVPGKIGSLKEDTPRENFTSALDKEDYEYSTPFVLPAYLCAEGIRCAWWLA